MEKKEEKKAKKPATKDEKPVAKEDKSPAIIKGDAHYECRGCGGKSYEVVVSIPTQYHEGYSPTGDRYTSIRRSVVSCNNCGQRLIVMAYDFDPALWKE